MRKREAALADARMAKFRFVSLISAAILLTQLASPSSAATSWGNSSNKCNGVSLDLPKVFLSGVNVVVTVHLPDYVVDMNGTTEHGDTGNDNDANVTLAALPSVMVFQFNHSGELVTVGNITRSDRSGLDVTIKISGSGHSHLVLSVEDVCELHSEEVYIIPAWLSIFPPIVTIALAIASKQVLVSLCAGIFLGCVFLFEYNPLTAFLRTYDLYLTNAVAEPDHAEILVATFLLGGLIGVVQKCGGAHGLASILRRLAKTRRSSQLVAVGMCFLVFFDDYSNILIVGNTLRAVMAQSGLSKNKFASIIHSMGPSIASIVPISSWIGVEVGAARGVLKTLNSTEEPFIYVVQTIPYRFFPMLMLFLPLIMSLIGWDFGPMLKAELDACRKHAATQSRPSVNYGSLSRIEQEGSDPEHDQLAGAGAGEKDVSAGLLEPKKGVPHRWFNAALPFLIVMIITFVGMILNGKAYVDANGIVASFVNYFGYCDAIAALMWSSALATWVALVLLLVQKIFTFSEFMEAWVIGVKELLEPVLILISAWGLGSIVSDLQASAWVANSIPASFRVEAIPVLASILACTMSYATGSAFGTISILFPLIVPLVGLKATSHKLPLLHQAGGAIFGGAIFGNVVAPIADNTILTTLSAPIGLPEHLKSQTPYVLMVLAVTLIFGDAMVAFHCYSVYVGLLLCTAVIVGVVLLIGQSPLRPDRKSFGLVGIELLRRRFRHTKQEEFTGALLPSQNIDSSLNSPEGSRIF